MINEERQVGRILVKLCQDFRVNQVAKLLVGAASDSQDKRPKQFGGSRLKVSLRFRFIVSLKTVSKFFQKSFHTMVSQAVGYFCVFNAEEGGADLVRRVIKTSTRSPKPTLEV